MTYYNKSDYQTRYRVTFKDLTESTWTVDIEDPGYTGSIMELTAAANPLEWDGQGSESQTDCILGSTGLLRLVCLQGQEPMFVVGGIRPSSFNERRVTIKRGSQVMWLGFLAKEEYNQEIMPAPYEVELPIKSVVACLEDFTLPPYGDFDEPSDNFSLLQYIVELTGADVTDIVTNVADYESFNGTRFTTGSGWQHWTEGEVVITHWYDRTSDGYEPKSLKEVLETILYPYGHLREYGNSWGIFMAAKYYSSYNNYIYRMSTDKDVSTSNRLVNTYNSIPTRTLGNLIPLSTGNRTSVVDAPSLIKYERDIKPDKEILTLSEEYIKGNYEPSTLSFFKTFGNTKRYVLPIGVSLVNTFFANEIEISSNAFFCRAIDFTKLTSDGNDYSHTDVVPLGFFLNGSDAKLEMKLMDEVRSRAGYNRIRLSITEYHLNTQNPITDPTKSNLKIKIKDQGMYLHQDGSWTQYETWLHTNNGKLDLRVEGSERVVYFNEPRNSADKSPHKLKVTIKYDDDGTELIYGELKLQYVEDTTLSDESIKKAARQKTQYNVKKVSTGSCGENLDVEMKTMCGQIYDSIEGAANIPFCGFKDKTGLIDTSQRKVVEFDAVRYNASDPLFLVRNYALITEDSTTYVPASVGCKARDCTMKLKLIQTNVL